VQGKQIIYAVEQGNKVKSRIIETNGTSGLNLHCNNGVLAGDVVVLKVLQTKRRYEIASAYYKSEDAANTQQRLLLQKTTTKK
jgi:membrane fusion protein (multidrug efflux system)